MYSEPRGSLKRCAAPDVSRRRQNPARRRRRQALGLRHLRIRHRLSVPIERRTHDSVHVAECVFQPGAVVHDLQAHGGSLVLCAAQSFLIIVDSKEVVGRRRRHQAGMRRCRPRGQRSPLWPQRAAAWPLVPRSARTNAPRSGPSFHDSTFWDVNVQMTHATRLRLYAVSPDCRA